MSNGASMEAIEQLYRARYADFVRTASAIANSRESGCDAVHDAFVAAVRSRARYRGDGTLEAWVWPMIVHNASKRRRTREFPLNGDHPEPIWADMHFGEGSEIRAAVSLLPSRQRLVLFLRHYGGLTYEEIGQAAGIRPGTVGAELHAAHRSLRLHLKEVRIHD